MKEQRKKGKVVLIKGESQYNVLTYACEEMAKGFEMNGYEAVVLVGKEIVKVQKAIEILKQEMADHGILIFSFNALFGEVLVNENLGMFDYLGFPVFAFLVDHPYFHTIRLNKNAAEKHYLSCVDYNHVAYVHKYHPNVKNVVFLPHFGFRAAEYIPYEEKKIDIYFPGSYYSLNDREKTLQLMPDVFHQIASGLIAEMLKDGTLVLEEVLENYLASIHFEYSKDEFTELMNAMTIVDQYVRDYQRNRVITTILESGIGLTVAGAGWSILKERYSDKIELLSEKGLDIEENIKVIANSKIILNVLPGFKNGSHERVFTALMNECICLSDKNQFFAEQFIDGQEIVYYDMEHLERLPEIIHMILQNPENAKQIAVQGRDKVKDEYGFSNLAGKILNTMGYE